MPKEPSVKRAIAFFDGQNLYHACKEAFDYHWPNFDPSKLSKKICKDRSLKLIQVRFYTGIISCEENPLWHHFWVAKLGYMNRKKVFTYSRQINRGREKGIDVRIALDMVRLARKNEYDVGIIFSQDQDLNEAVKEVKNISIEYKRWIKICSAFPSSPHSSRRRGISGAEPIPFEKSLYDSCIDHRDYRPKNKI